MDKFGYFAGSIEERAEEINSAFRNKDVKAIIAVSNVKPITSLENEEMEINS